MRRHPPNRAPRRRHRSCAGHQAFSAPPDSRARRPPPALRQSNERSATAQPESRRPPAVRTPRPHRGFAVRLRVGSPGRSTGNGQRAKCPSAAKPLRKPSSTGIPLSRSRCAVGASMADGTEASTAIGASVLFATSSTASAYAVSPSNSVTRSTASAVTPTPGSAAIARRQEPNRLRVSAPVPQTSSGLVGAKPSSSMAADVWPACHRPDRRTAPPVRARGRPAARVPPRSRARSPHHRLAIAVPPRTVRACR